eukprot:682508-Rhodomonas_salina.2
MERSILGIGVETGERSVEFRFRTPGGLITPETCARVHFFVALAEATAFSIDSQSACNAPGIGKSMARFGHRMANAQSSAQDGGRGAT